MVTQWERFAARSPFTIDALGGEDAIEIYNGSTNYTPGEGNENTYDLDNPDATLDAETMAPSAVSGIEDAGTFEGISQVAFIDSDTSATLKSYDNTDDPPSIVKVLENGKEYDLQEIVTQGDGYTMLTLMER
jgi:hypothetical protein